MKNLALAMLLVVMMPQHGSAQSIINCAETISELNDFARYNVGQFTEYMKSREDVRNYVVEGNRLKLSYDGYVRTVERKKDHLERSLRSMGGWFERARTYKCSDEQSITALERRMADLFLRLRHEHRNPLPTLPEPHW